MSEPKRKTLKGTVVSDKMHKSIIIELSYQKSDRRFKKTVRRSKKIMVHDESNIAKIGDVVSIGHSRPRSKRKSHELVEVIAKK